MAAAAAAAAAAAVDIKPKTCARLQQTPSMDSHLRNVLFRQLPGRIKELWSV